MITIFALCCEQSPKYEVTYQTGETIRVCSDCIQKPHWASFIKEKRMIE